MLNSLNLIVIVFMALAAASLVALGLMFLVRNPLIQKICFYIVAALGIYAGSIGIRIGKLLFPVQTGIGILGICVSIASIVMATAAKDNEKKFKTAQGMAAAALIVGIINAIV